MFRVAPQHGGAGVARGTLTIYDTTGEHAELDLSDDDIQTVDDAIKFLEKNASA